MDTRNIDLNDAIIIGDLAKLYNISKRTLRLYHEMELLVPYYVDQQTGYRYYSFAQLQRLDMILQMKNAGLSLKQIKQVLSTQDLSLFEAVLGEQIDRLEQKIAEFRTHRSALFRQLESCKYIRNPPILNTVFVEYIPRRTAFICDIEPYDLEGSYAEDSPWKDSLEQVKSVFMDRSLPLALFHQVGCIVSREDLLQKRFICGKAFICFNNEPVHGLPLSNVDPGSYVCMYHRYTAMDNAAESRGIHQILDYIEAHHYHIQGPYFAQVMAETSVFNYSSSNILVKQQIPIRVLP